MKKIIPILTLIGASSLIVGCDIAWNKPQNIDSLSLKQLSSNLEALNNNTEQIKVIKDKYLASLSTPIDATLVDSDNVEIIDNEHEIKEIENSDLTPNINDNTNDNTNENILENYPNESEIEIQNENQNNENQILKNDIDNSAFSTLYSINNDINECCEEYLDLKLKLENAISETKNLISKLSNGEIELTPEQKQKLKSQSVELCKLANSLTQATNQLSFSANDLTKLNLNNDEISLKYLIVLNNLINNNEMLQTGLETLNNLNNIFYSYQANIPENSRGRFMFGYRNNNENPIIKDYYINENGEFVENNNENSVEANERENNSNVDTYNNTNLTHNIDTYGNFNQNTDTFFNTALLDNEFMYGAPYGRAGFGFYGNNPYLNQYNQYQAQKQNYSANYGVDNNNLTQDKGENTKPKKRFKLKKNVDTYKNANTPSLKSKFENMKNWFTNRNPKNQDNIENPIYRIDKNN